MNLPAIPTSKEFLAQIHLFRRKTKMSKTMFSRVIANDVSFLVRMQSRGKTLTLKRAHHIQQNMIEFQKKYEQDKHDEFLRERDIKSLQR